MYPLAPPHSYCFFSTKRIIMFIFLLSVSIIIILVIMIISIRKLIATRSQPIILLVVKAAIDEMLVEKKILDFGRYVKVMNIT